MFEKKNEHNEYDIHSISTDTFDRKEALTFIENLM
jgi:hypothetical protein